jgi:hypothetical protein
VTQSGSAPAGPEATAPPRRAAEPPPRREEPPVPTPEPEPEPDPQPTTAILSVAVSPSDANLVIDGRRAPSARTEREFQIGTTVTVAASRPGYASAERTITISAEGSAVELRLEARPLEASVEVAPGPLVRGLASDGIRGYAADRAGTVYAIDPSGRVLWSVATATEATKTRHQRSPPGTSPSPAPRSGLFSTPPTDGSSPGSPSRGPGPISLAESGPLGNRLLFPSDEEIAILDVQGNPTGRTIPIPVAPR